MKKICFSLLCILLFWSSNLYAVCWDTKERAEILGFSELDDILILSFKDAVDCKPIANATLSIKGSSVITNAKGYVKMPMGLFSSLDDADIKVKIEHSRYISFATKLRVRAGSVWNKRFLLSRRLPIDKVRFVLQWAEKPRDLDLHLVSSDMHISYRKTRSVMNQANLDRDDRDGIGPETLTLERVNSSDTYRIYIRNYSREKSLGSSIHLSVYANGRLDKIISLPETNQRVVLAVEIRNGKIHYPLRPTRRIR
ncbi:MAG: hypothetical protein ACI86H_001151 [bacterium]|jgi:hypothetical protein